MGRVIWSILWQWAPLQIHTTSGFHLSKCKKFSLILLLPLARTHSASLKDSNNNSPLPKTAILSLPFKCQWWSTHFLTNSKSGKGTEKSPYHPTKQRSYGPAFFTCVLTQSVRFIFIGEKLVLEKLESSFILFYFKRENKIRKKILKKWFHSFGKTSLEKPAS